MTEPLNVNPDRMRQLAIHHEREADNIRAQVAPPTEWLDSYLARYGKITLPVYNALLRYVDARQSNGNALADAHQLTAEQLRSSADQMELVDQQSGQSIERAGLDRPHAVSAHPVHDTVAPAGPTSAAAPSHAAPSNVSSSDSHAAATADDDTSPDGATPMAAPAPVYGGGRDSREGSRARTARTSDGTDLDLARMLLSTIIETAPDIPGLAWAVSVMRAGEVVQAFVTSNRARGWLPAGVLLPSTIATPWAPVFASALDGADNGWEGAPDPARILVEFGSVWGPRNASQLTALVTTGPVDESLRAAVPDAAVEGGITRGMYPIDTSAELVDRLDIYSFGGLDTAMTTVPDAMIRACVIGLAADAHTRVGRRNRDGAELHRLRERILAQLAREQAIPSAWWVELRHADAGATEQHLGAAGISVDEPPSGHTPDTARTLAFELYADELLLLLADEPSRQLLRDAAYSYAQIVNHPLLDTDSAATTAARPIVVTAPNTVTAPPPVDVPGPTTPSFRDTGSIE